MLTFYNVIEESDTISVAECIEVYECLWWNIARMNRLLILVCDIEKNTVEFGTDGRRAFMFLVSSMTNDY